MHINPIATNNATPTTIWIAECFSCQFDLIQLIKQHPQLKHLRVLSSHTQHRPELQQVSDLHLQQPSISQSALWLLEQCQKHQVSLLFCGKKSVHIEAEREKFVQANIQLVTGCIGVDNHHVIEDKFAFFQACQQQQFPVTPAIKVTQPKELTDAIAQLKTDYDSLCVKPVIGVYGFGFCRLKENASYFRHFEDPLVCQTQQFIDAYAAEATPRPYLVMPYLSGVECSVDIACSEGQILSQVTRIKHAAYQQCLTDGPCDHITTALVQSFRCDGLINIQFKQNQQGEWFILEINSRPAGGFAYSQHTGINLIADLIAHKLAINLNVQPITHSVWVRPMTTPLAVEFETP